MTVDIRARVFCSLGPVISGELSDTFVQEDGVVRTRGQVLLSGIYQPKRGSLVKLGYLRNGKVTRFPRTVRALSFSADPLDGVTTVQLGCKLTMGESVRLADQLQTLSVAPQWWLDLPESMKNQMVIPARAQDVVGYCMSKLGISIAGSGYQLVHRYVRARYDLTRGYLAVAAEMIRSESCFAFLNPAEQLVIRKVRSTGGKRGPVLRRNRLIDMEPIVTSPQEIQGMKVMYQALTAPMNWQARSIAVSSGV